ncbi:hypothetical protein OAB57_03645 [Bacteriovoracaceae bacterium]|nr:hypothetical protein [Bacteriovoracaceae bacterium]
MKYRIIIAIYSFLTISIGFSSDLQKLDFKTVKEFIQLKKKQYPFERKKRQPVALSSSYTYQAIIPKGTLVASIDYDHQHILPRTLHVNILVNKLQQYGFCYILDRLMKPIYLVKIIDIKPIQNDLDIRPDSYQEYPLKSSKVLPKIYPKFHFSLHSGLSSVKNPKLGRYNSAQIGQQIMLYIMSDFKLNFGLGLSRYSNPTWTNSTKQSLSGLFFDLALHLKLPSTRSFSSYAQLSIGKSLTQSYKDLNVQAKTKGDRISLAIFANPSKVITPLTIGISYGHIRFQDTSNSLFLNVNDRGIVHTLSLILGIDLDLKL